MSRLCIEDGFEYNIKRAVKRFLEDFDGDRVAAAEAYKDSEHAEQFAVYLLDQAESYIDVESAIKFDEDDNENN